MLRSKFRRVEIYETLTGRRPLEEWLLQLKDHVAHGKILARIRRVEAGNFGHYRDLGGGVYELKEVSGPGYRVYFTVHRDEIVLLLISGKKSSQTSDIEKARRYREDYIRR